jgi:hypothetical protein
MGNQPTSISLIMQNGPNPGQVLTIQDRPQIMGRGTGSNIVIADKTLSRKHAKVWATPDGLVVEDLGSTNGTFVNRQRISGPTRLRPGDILKLGDNVTFNVQPVQVSAENMDTVTPGVVAAPGTIPTEPGPTAVPGTPPAPVYAPPVQPGPGPWIWVGLALIIAVLIVGAALGYLFYSRAAQTQPTVQAVVPPTPTLPQAPTPIPTQAPTPTPAPTSTPTLSPTPAPIQVPGIPAVGAEERQPPQNITNKISPFCEREIEVEANEPVLISWQRRVADDDQTDYLAQWLEAAYFDLRLDGRSITNWGALNYYPDESCAESGLCGPALNWWINVGLLEAGTHHLTLEWYTDREISNGLDVEPADGQVDVFGPGLAGESFCDIVVAEAATPVAEVTATPTTKPITTQPQQAAPLGIFQDFESASTWKRGDQPYGEFTRSSAQVHSGSYAGQLSYNFPTSDNDYVVFLQSRRLAGRPNAISAWVYGDGSGHFFNVWIKDANGQSWQMSFGQVKHTGWQEMMAFLDPGQPWPSAHISGPNNGAIDYPISFEALVLDDGSDNYSGSGTIYIDDLNSQEGATPPTTPPQVVAPTATSPGGQTVPASSGIYTLRIGSQHRYEEPWGAPKGGNPCRSWENNDWDDEHPDYRGFNVELLLTNNSAVKVQDNWGDGMRFFTSGGQEVVACYYAYGGAGPVPGGTTSLTFFTVVPKGQFVQTMQLNLNGQFVQICLDGRGGWSGC